MHPSQGTRGGNDPVWTTLRGLHVEIFEQGYRTLTRYSPSSTHSWLTPHNADAVLAGQRRRAHQAPAHNGPAPELRLRSAGSSTPAAGVTLRPGGAHSRPLPASSRPLSSPTRPLADAIGCGGAQHDCTGALQTRDRARVEAEAVDARPLAEGMGLFTLDAAAAAAGWTRRALCSSSSA